MKTNASNPNEEEKKQENSKTAENTPRTLKK